MARSAVEVKWSSSDLLKVTQKAMRAGFTEAGKHGRKEVKAALSSTGESSPGEAPGKVSGALRRSVAYRVKSRSKKYVVVDVGVLLPSKWDSKAPGKSFPGRMHAQALRLARGYVGRDRLGRTYSVPGRPFVEPVLKREAGTMAKLIESGAAKYMPKAKKGTR